MADDLSIYNRKPSEAEQLGLDSEHDMVRRIERQCDDRDFFIGALGATLVSILVRLCALIGEDRVESECVEAIKRIREIKASLPK